MTREQLGVALWPDQSRERLGNALHTALRELRRALGDPGWVRVRRRPVRLQRGPGRTTATSRRSSRRWRPPGGPGPPRRPCPTCSGRSRPTAATSWPGWPRANGRRPAGTSWPQLRGGAARDRPAARRGRPASSAAVAAFRRAVAHEPLNETAHRELMSCWARLGETARAVRHYTELVELLPSPGRRAARGGDHRAVPAADQRILKPLVFPPWPQPRAARVSPEPTANPPTARANLCWRNHTSGTAARPSQQTRPARPHQHDHNRRDHTGPRRDPKGDLDMTTDLTLTQPAQPHRSQQAPPRTAARDPPGPARRPWRQAPWPQRPRSPWPARPARARSAGIARQPDTPSGPWTTPTT